jgi:hypothetical protein
LKELLLMLAVLSCSIETSAEGLQFQSHPAAKTTTTAIEARLMEQ